MNHKQKAAFLSILTNIAIIILKIAVGVIINSISVISEAIHSAMDLVSALIAYFTVSKSSQPADRSHPYGHGKFENLSGFLEAALIAIAAIYILVESIQRLLHPREIHFVPYGIAVMLISALVNYFIYRHNMKVARETESIALETNAAHLSADMYTSLGVLGGLALIALTGIKALDSLAAMAVAAFIMKASVDLMRKTIRDLTDRGLPEEEEKEIRAILENHYAQFVGFHKLRTRKSGPERYIDLHLVLAKNIDLPAAHDLCTHLEGEIHERFPGSQTIIHIEPCENSCRTCNISCPPDGSLPEEEHPL